MQMDAVWSQGPTKRWANLQKVMKLEKLAHFQCELTFLEKWSPGGYA